MEVYIAGNNIELNERAKKLLYNLRNQKYMVMQNMQLKKTIHDVSVLDIHIKDF